MLCVSSAHSTTLQYATANLLNTDVALLLLQVTRTGKQHSLTVLMAKQTSASVLQIINYWTSCHSQTLKHQQHQDAL